MPPAPIEPTGRLISQTNNNPRQGGRKSGGAITSLDPKTARMGSTMLNASTHLWNFLHPNEIVPTNLGTQFFSGQMPTMSGGTSDAWEFAKLSHAIRWNKANPDKPQLPVDFASARNKTLAISGGRMPSSMDTPFQLRPENHPFHKYASNLVDDLFEAGLAGGKKAKKSHKGQYVRWMLGRVRGDRDGDPTPEDAYRTPHGYDPKRLPSPAEGKSLSNPTSSHYAGWSPDDWEGNFSPFNPELVKGKKVSKFIKGMIPKKQKTVVRPMGIDELIIRIDQTHTPKPTTREIVDIIKKQYGRDTSQPTVARRLKAFRDGKIDAKGKAI